MCKLRKQSCVCGSSLATSSRLAVICQSLCTLLHRLSAEPTLELAWSRDACKRLYRRHLWWRCSDERSLMTSLHNEDNNTHFMITVCQCAEILHSWTLFWNDKCSHMWGQQHNSMNSAPTNRQTSWLEPSELLFLLQVTTYGVVMVKRTMTMAEVLK